MVFNNPELRQEYIDLYGLDHGEAKFKIGQLVVYRNNVQKMTWVGEVQGVNFEEENFEYLIEGSPFLAWEAELNRPKVIWIK